VSAAEKDKVPVRVAGGLLLLAGIAVTGLLNWAV
jgi:hypothetical protein